MAMIFVLLALLSFILWLLFGREPRYTTTVEFYPPEGMTPAEMGYLIDGSIDDKDIMSMIVYYAIHNVHIYHHIKHITVWRYIPICWFYIYMFKLFNPVI